MRQMSEDLPHLVAVAVIGVARDALTNSTSNIAANSRPSEPAATSPSIGWRLRTMTSEGSGCGSWLQPAREGPGSKLDVERTEAVSIVDGEQPPQAG
jgi:hypothetical protein